MNKNKLYSQYDIGDWTYGDPLIVSFGEMAKLKIGRFCSIADGAVILLGGEHRIDWITTYPFNVFFPWGKSYKGHPKTKGDVVIGNDVWIGREALILSGVKIGNGAVVGARSVVTKDIKPYSIVAGNPAKHIKYRFEESIIPELIDIAWWDWPISKIEKSLPLLLSGKVLEFIDNYKTK
jgi:acetyltransferase-like isoleucine patch superfamily enzyme